MEQRDHDSEEAEGTLPGIFKCFIVLVQLAFGKMAAQKSFEVMRVKGP